MDTTQANLQALVYLAIRLGYGITHYGWNAFDLTIVAGKTRLLTAMQLVEELGPKLEAERVEGKRQRDLQNRIAANRDMEQRCAMWISQQKAKAWRKRTHHVDPYEASLEKDPQAVAEMERDDERCGGTFSELLHGEV